MTFGKHAGRTFGEVKRLDPGYCSWVLRQERLGALTHFARFLRASAAGGPALQGGDGFATPPRPAPAPKEPRDGERPAVAVVFKDGTALPGRWRNLQDFLAPSQRRTPATPQGCRRPREEPKDADLRGFLRRKLGAEEASAPAEGPKLGAEEASAPAEG